jgi:hypothetical protein
VKNMSFTKTSFIINGTKSEDIGVDGAYLIRTDAEIN